jgi:hypothetical protein
VKRASIGYIRQNFWPLRQFTDLHDVNRQVQQWLKEVANQRHHREKRERPVDRLQPAALRPLPAPVLRRWRPPHSCVMATKPAATDGVFTGKNDVVPERH